MVPDKGAASPQKTMPISSRLVVRSTIVLLAVAFLTLVGIVGMTIWLGERSQNYFNEVIEARNARSASVDLRNAMQAAEASERGFLVTGNEIYLAPYGTAKARAQEHLDALRNALAPYREADLRLQRLGALVADKFTLMDQTIALKTDLRDEDALALFRTNRGKALTDEANVFLSAITLTADERLTAGVIEQRQNAIWLRWVSILGGLVIVAVVGGFAVVVLQYAREIVQARDEVRALNYNLEERVKTRTADLAQARDRAEVLLAEVNHRIANSLSLVASLVGLQMHAVQDPPAKNALRETQSRIYAIGLVHKRLYSNGNARLVALDEYLAGLLDHLETSMRAEGLGAVLRYEIAPLQLKTDTAINLGVVVAELVTNAFKYAYPDGRGDVRVRMKALPDGQAELVVEDDGIGRRTDGPARGTGLGTRIVQSMAANMKGELNYTARNPGTAARLTFPA